MSNSFEEKLGIKIKGLVIIYLTMIIGLLLFLGVIVFLHYNAYFNIVDKELEYILSTSALLVSIAAIPLGYYLFSSKAKQSVLVSDDAEKLSLYETSIITKLAIFEFAGFANLIVFLLTKNQQSLIIFAVVIVIFLINRPSSSNYLDNFE